MEEKAFPPNTKLLGIKRLDNVMKLDFSEYGKDRENRDAVKERLMENNGLFKDIVGLYEEVKADEKGPHMIIVTPLERMPSSRINAIIDNVIDQEIESAEYPESPVVVEPLRTIYQELHQIKGTARCEFKISDKTRKYLENHPEVKLYRVKAKEKWSIRREFPEDHEKEFYIFESDESSIRGRIQDRQNYIHASSPTTPVRHISIDILEVEQLDLKSLDSLME
ncbi:hypothetical protein KY343_01530 [Candidatus Woesearchaeota archaeon]|nr:hypothetical protein [Candidatus Woesearchaeota archaeon]